MPVIHDIPLSLKSKGVLRREGLGGRAKVRPEIKSLIEELLASVESNRLLGPAAAYEYYPVTGMSGVQISLECDRAVMGLAIPSLFPEAKEIAVLIGTIGPNLEKQATAYFNRHEPLRGLLLDGIGNAAVDSLTQEVCKFIAAESLSRGYQVSSPINPGMPGLPITEQRQMLKLVPAEEIGVSLTSSGVMVPRKSTSMVIGIGPKMTRWTQASICVHCSLGETCPYRIPV